MAELINNSNDDSFERRLQEIGMFQSEPVDSLTGDLYKPVAMINEFSPIAELEDGEIPDPIYNSTMVSDPVSTVTVPEPSPVEQVDNSYQLNPDELATRLNNTQPSVPVPGVETISVRDPGCGIPFYARAGDRPENETGPSISWDGFAGDLKIITQTVLLNKGVLSVNKKKVQKLQEDIFNQQLQYEKVEDSNKEVSANTVQQAETIKKLEKESQDLKETFKNLTHKHEVLTGDYENCKSMLDEAKRFEINAYGGAAQIAATLQTSYDDQLKFSKLQKEEINELHQRINKLTKERQSFLKLAEQRMKQFNDRAEHGIDRLVKAHERSVSVGNKQETEITELETELEEAYEENDKLAEELGCQPDDVAEMDSVDYEDNVTKLENTSRALQGKVRELAVVNRTLLEQHLNLSAVAGTKVTRTTTTVGLPNRRPGAVRRHKARNVTFSGYDSVKPGVRSTLNKTV